MREPLPTITGPGAIFASFVLMYMWQYGIAFTPANLQLAAAIWGTMSIVYNLVFGVTFNLCHGYQKFGYQGEFRNIYSDEHIRDSYGLVLYGKNSKVSQQSIEMLRRFVGAYLLYMGVRGAIILSSLITVTLRMFSRHQVAHLGFAIVFVISVGCLFFLSGDHLAAVDEEMTSLEKELIGKEMLEVLGRAKK